MKEQGKHIRYLKRILDLITSNILLIILFCIIWVLLLNGNAVNYVLNVVYNVFNMEVHKISEQQDINPLYKILVLISKTVISTIVSFVLNNLILKKFSDIKKRRARRRGKIYRNLSKLYNKSNKRWAHVVVPVCINVFFHGKPLGYSSQLNYVHDVINYLDTSNSNKHIIWIEGAAYSGKTTIIFRFLEELSAKTYIQLFEEYEHKIYYFDFGFSSLNHTSLCRNIEDYIYEDSLLILDNIHKLDSDGLTNFIRTLENYHKRIKFIICLSRAFDEFCFSKEIRERLRIFVEEYATLVNINFQSKDEKNILEEIAFTTKNFQSDYENFCQSIIKNKEQLSNPVLAVQYYNLYIATLGQKNPRFLLKVFNILNCNMYESTLAYTLSFIIHATLFSGNFDIEWFHNFLDSNQNGCKRHIAKKHFHKLLKSGFISVVESSDNSAIAFHERLSRYYFELINQNPDFSDINAVIINYLAQKNHSEGRVANEWKYRILIMPITHETRELFNQSLFFVNFNTLLDDLQYIIKEKRYSEDLFYRELGILYDRVGRLEIAKKYFEKALEQSFNPAIYINLIQVDHEKFRAKTLKPFLTGETGDAYMRIAAKYWKAHISMHDGKFNINDFISLLPEWENCNKEILEKYSYDGLHLMRRWYFDCFRVYYLSGTSDPELIKGIIDSHSFSAIYKFPEFEAYRNKFQYAFYLHYDLLFQRGIFGAISDTKLKKWDTIMLSQNGIYQKLKQANETGKSQLNIIIEEAEKYYQDSCYGLKRIMDKSYRYSEMRIRELRLAYSNVTFEDIRNNESYFEDYIQHSKDINIDEYVAYGYTYLLKNYLVGQYSLCSEYDDNPCLQGRLDNLYISDKMICECIKNVEYYHGRYRGKRSNCYCILRLNIYKVLYNYLSTKITYEQASMEIKNLLATAHKRKYHREERLLDYLQKKKLDRVIIIKTFKYYPLILQ